jgi:hypothetical protein
MGVGLSVPIVVVVVGLLGCTQPKDVAQQQSQKLHALFVRTIKRQLDCGHPRHSQARALTYVATGSMQSSVALDAVELNSKPRYTLTGKNADIHTCGSDGGRGQVSRGMVSQSFMTSAIALRLVILRGFSPCEGCGRNGIAARCRLVLDRA